jgi:hypothetical protein
MKGLTDYITERPWGDIITTWYVLVDDAYQRLIAQRGATLRLRGPAPIFSDSEVITVSLIIACIRQSGLTQGEAKLSPKCVGCTIFVP